ncbi:MAG: hypothetical protein CMH57_00310 [Myxococcales bacterium]|nr:hypothetical protein [Myxococcales bacterium]
MEPDAAPMDNEVAASGLIIRLSAAGDALPLGDATITLSSDRNGDGAVSDDERCATTSDAQGRFSLNCVTTDDRRVVLSASAPGTSRVHRTFNARQGAVTTWQITLRDQEALTCEDARCELPSGAIALEGVPDGISAQGWTLGAPSPSDALPSDSIDRSGNLLLPGVIAELTWLDAEGVRVAELEAPAMAWIRLPQSVWGRVSDIEPGNDQIDVPLYHLDPNSGRWVRQGDGMLVNVFGESIQPGDLGSLTSNYPGEVFVQAAIARGGIWSVQWVLETRSCIQGVLLADGAPVEGAFVRVQGLSYDGRSAPALTDAQGSFCVETLRSEMTGEDLNGNGDEGEAYRVRLQGSLGGAVYDLGEHEVRSDESACGEGGCLSLGEVALDSPLEAESCTVAGLVTDLFGQPVRGVTLQAWSQAELSEADIASLCGDDFEDCDLSATTDMNGVFVLETPRLGGLTLRGTILEELATRSRLLTGQRTLQSCPDMPVTLVLDEGYERLSFDVELNGEEITWSPEAPIIRLDVADSTGELKWSLRSANGFEGPDGPITYGVTPDGADVLVPESGEPAALESGDVITIWTHLTLPLSDGYTTLGEGTLTLP